MGIIPQNFSVRITDDVPDLFLCLIQGMMDFFLSLFMNADHEFD